MATGVVHELSNPLATIMLLAANAQSATATLESTRSSFKKIADEVQRCGEIVRSVLQFARSDQLVKVNGQINESVAQAITFLEHFARDRGVEIAASLAGDLPEVLHNETAIQHAVVNLIKRACDADAIRVTVTTERTDEGVRINILEVGETGATGEAGEAEEPDEAHEARETREVRDCAAAASTTGRSGVAEPGLALAHSIADDHGGTITVVTGAMGRTKTIFDLPGTVSAHDNQESAARDSRMT
jgi:two-component system sensor histidine kinase DctS